MIFNFKKNLILLVTLFVICFISLYFLLGNSIKDNEKSNVSIDYYFDEQLLDFLKKEEIKIRNAIKFVNNFGYNITENEWLFPSDGISNTLNTLAQNFDLYKFILTSTSKNNQIKIENGSIEKLLVNSKKVVDKSKFKISILFSFDDYSYVEMFFLNQNLIREFFDEELNYTVSEKIRFNNELLFSINEFMNIIKNICDNYTKFNVAVDQNMFNEKFQRIFQEINYLDAFMSGKCNDLNFKKFVPYNLTPLNNDMLKQDNYGVKNNEMSITYTSIKKTILINYILFIFMISLSLSLFLIMLINKLKNEY